MSAPRMTIAESDELAEWWWRTKDAQMPEPWTSPRLVPFCDLKPCGAGSVIAAAIHEELRENGYSEGGSWW